MVKRLLAFVLSAAMVLEAPATALAAEQAPVLGEESQEASDTIEPVDEASSATFELVQVDGEPNSDGAYDFVRTFQVQLKNNDGDVLGDVQLADSYTLGLSIRKHVEGEVEPGDAAYIEAGEVVLSGDDHKATVYSTELLEGLDGTDGIASPLLPETEYDLKWTLKADKDDAEPGETTVAVYTETVETNPAVIYFANENVEDDELKYKVTIDKDSFAAAEKFAQSIEMYLYYRKAPDNAAEGESSNYTAANIKAVLDKDHLDNEGNYVATLSLAQLAEDLEANTKYEFGLYYNNDTDAFTGVAWNEIYKPEIVNNLMLNVSDNSDRISDNNPLTINYEITGAADDQKYYVFLYLELGSSIPDDAEPSYLSDELTGNYKGKFVVDEVLEVESAYTYLIGIGTEETTSLSELTNIYNHTFIIDDVEDERSLTVGELEVGATSAVFPYTLSGNENNTTYVIIFYREYIENYEGVYTRYDWNKWENEDIEDVLVLAALTPGKTYEYVFGYASSFVSYADELILPEDGSGTGRFTTKPDIRKLNVTFIDEGSTSVTVNYDLSDSEDDLQSFVYLYYREDKGEESGDWLRNNDEYVDSHWGNGSGSRSVEGLKAGTKYQYLIGIGTYENSAVSSLKAKETGTFETADDAVPDETAPSKITLSEEEIYLNWGYMVDDDTGEAFGPGLYGYNIKTIKVDVSKDSETTATGYYIAEYPDYGVAYAYIDYDNNIHVEARGVGTTTLTVKSTASDNVSATLKVNVNNYAIVDGENLGTSWAAYPQGFQSKEKYSLVRYVEGGGSEPVSNFTVTSSNTSIVKWIDGENKLQMGDTRGRAYLTFADAEGHYKADMMVDVYSLTKGFDITGLAVWSGDDDYAAIDNGGSYTIAVGNEYEALIENEPYNNDSEYADLVDRYDITWTVKTGSDFVTVSDDGIITPVKAGTATVEAYFAGIINDNTVIYPEIRRTITINVVKVPDLPENRTVYALANTVSKLSDIECPGKADGWTWAVPDASIITNAASQKFYSFDIVCEGANAYPRKSEVTVYMTKVTGLNLFNSEDDPDNEKPISSAVIEANGDALTLTVNPVIEGYPLSNSTNIITAGYDDYTIDIPTVAGLDIKVYKDDYADHTNYRTGRKYVITASNAGTYTIKPVVSVKYKDKTKVLSQAACKITVSKDPVVKNIEFTIDNENVKYENGVYYVDLKAGNEVGTNIPEVTEVKDFNVTAKLIGRNTTTDDNANNSAFDDVKLTWKVSDAKVAKVTTAQAGAHEAKVEFVGEGHTVLTATVKDAAGYVGSMNIEFRNHAPRVDVSKVTVNPAYDYSNDDGLELAYKTGAIEIVQTSKYKRDDISRVEVYDGTTKSTTLNAYVYDYYTSTLRTTVVIGTVTNESDAKSGDYKLLVTTESGRQFEYPLKVTVAKKDPKVTIKTTKTVNLFYTNDNAQVTVSASDGASIEEVKWKSDSKSTDRNGFASVWEYTHYDPVSKKSGYIGEQENIKLDSKNKLDDPDIAKGTFTVKLSGYWKAYDVKTTIKTNYKKPSIVSKSASTTIIPAMAGHSTNSFCLYNNTMKYPVYFSNSYYGEYDDYVYNYDKITSTNPNVKVTYNSDDWVSYEYNNAKQSGSEKATFELKSKNWREPVTVTHTIKLAKPTAYLSNSQITINTTAVSASFVLIGIKNYYDSETFDEIDIKGKDTNSAELLRDNRLEILHDEHCDGISIYQNRASAMNLEPIKAGTYSYNITPYYTAADGTRQALNTLVLKVKVVNNEVTAKVKTKGTLDLVKGADGDGVNYIQVTPTFANIGSDYYVSEAEVVGEYSEYFHVPNIEEGYDYDNGYRPLWISAEGVGKLKAKQKYKLAIKYTVYTDYYNRRDPIVVTSAPFTVTPKQSAPNLKVADNNQTLYASARLSRNYTLDTRYKVGKYYEDYTVSDASGSIDCNKDGKEDIKITGCYDNYGSCRLTVSIVDYDGAVSAAGTKGKTYTIPVTVKLYGRDGVSKDATASIKVTVKR